MHRKRATKTVRSDQAPGRRPNRRRSLALEGLEGRTLLAIMSAVDLSGKLLITASADDSIAILSRSGDVKIDGSDPGSGPFPSDGITAIQIVCTAATGADSNVVDLGDVTPSHFAALTSVSVDGGGGQNRLIGPNIPILWGITSRDAGILAGDALGAIASFTFQSIENLVGGLGDDTFVFNEGASLSGSIDGGGGNNTLDFSGVTDALSVTLTGSDSGGFHGDASGIDMGFRGIQALIGGLGNDTLRGDDAASTWNLDGSPTYSDGVASLSFSRFENLQGGSGTDEFILIGDALGNLAENIDGGSGADRFLFEGDVTLTGTIVGGAGADTLDFSDYGIAVAIALSGSSADGYAGTEPTAFSGGGFQGIDSIVGPPASDAVNTIAGENSTSLWILGTNSSYDDGSGRALMISNFANIDGGTGNDTYQIGATAGTALSLVDGGGDNTLDFSHAPSGITINVDSAETQTIAPGTTLTLSGQFANIIGSTFPDLITIAGSDRPRSVDGGLPVTFPGDTLIFDAGGRSVTLSYNQIIANGLAPVTYTGIETTRIINDSGVTTLPFPVTLSLAITPIAPRYGDPLTFSLTVSPDVGAMTPTGTVQFAVDGVPSGPAISLVRGVATAPAIATLATGSHLVSATYSGDANFAANTTSPTTVNVARAPLTIAAQDATKVYGQANPAFAASYRGFVLGQDASALGGTLSFDTSAQISSHVGLYTIVPGGLVSANYSIAYDDGLLHITPAMLTIRADDATQSYGAPLPPLSASYSGFVDGDGPSSLTTPVILATAASPTSGPGTYTITPGGAVARDYTITFVDGTLTVLPTAIVGPMAGPVAFVTSLYREILGRAPEPAGLRYWVGRLARGSARGEVVLEFFASPERRSLRRQHRATAIRPRVALALALRAERSAQAPSTAGGTKRGPKGTCHFPLAHFTPTPQYARKVTILLPLPSPA